MTRRSFISSCSLALGTALILFNSPVVSAEETLQESVQPQTTTPELTMAHNDAIAQDKLEAETNAEILDSTRADDETTPETKELVILHTNDIHGRIEEGRGVIGMDKLATLVEQERETSNQTTVLLDAGDAFQGLPISNSTKGEDMAAIMNQVGYDAMAVGNHEFDFGLEQVQKYKETLKFPLLSTNTYLNGARLFESSTVIDKDTTVEGDELVVIGVTTPETYTKTHPNNIVGVEFRDPISEVKSAISTIEAHATATGKTYNRYVVLAHLGIDDTTDTAFRGDTLAQALANFEPLKTKQVVVIDGHSHSVKDTKFGNVTYAQTGSYLANVGKIAFKSSGVIETSLISESDAKSLTPNPEVKAAVDAISEKFKQENAQVVIDHNPVELNGERSNVRVRETNLGNIVADALYEYGQTGFANKTDLAITNGGGLRETIAKDQPITKGDVIAVLPFGNIISQITVKGAQIKAAFEHGLDADIETNDAGDAILDDNTQLPLLSPAGHFLHSSGVRVYFDPTKEAFDAKTNTGGRVLSIEILDRETGEYTPLDLEKTYYLATNDFIAAGGDGYTMLGGAREEGPSMDAVFMTYLQNNKTRLTEYAEINTLTRIIPIDSTQDADNDGKTNGDEFEKGTDPFKQETAAEPNTSRGNELDKDDNKVHDATSTDKVKSDDKAPLAKPTQHTSSAPTTAVEVTTQSAELPQTGSAEFAIFAPAVLSVLSGLGLMTLSNRKKEIDAK